MSSLITKAFENFSDQYLKFNSATIEQHKLIDSIKVCKTAALGYNIQACEDCGAMQTHYNSCGNRHCPNCQAINKDKWILSKQNDVLPVIYHHTIFTVPAELRTLFKYNKALLYNLLFKCAWETIESFSKDPRNRIEAKMGMIAILHTWKQNLDYHPHLHCIIPSGGITANDKWKSSPSEGNYLFNYEALAKTFKGKFMFYLKMYYKDNKLQFWDLKNISSAEYFYYLKESLYKMDWVAHSRKSFKSHDSVFEYLGRYTHKIAISNARIKKVNNTHVSFEYTDRADNYKKKIRKVEGVKFIKLFLQHVLPNRFMKIRNYGFLSSRNKTPMLKKLFEYFKKPAYTKPKSILVAELIKLIYKVEVGVCKHCGGQMRVIESKNRPQKTRASPIIKMA
ncbi:MAG: IS91 family transposase [Bacteroidota bacterium]|nr:IS91 family transposase [Bacteroidota bacterium]MEA3505218.1 IS91 family transposase [Bacteroidota bacterium]